jgi:hypothetical protein
MTLQNQSMAHRTLKPNYITLKLKRSPWNQSSGNIWHIANHHSLEPNYGTFEPKYGTTKTTRKGKTPWNLSNNNLIPNCVVESGYQDSQLLDKTGDA